MKIKPILEAKLASQPEASFARLKRVARELQQVLPLEVNRYESTKSLIVLEYPKTLYHSDMEKLNNRFGEAREIDVPEFKVPWYRWQVDNVWITMKMYGGTATFEIFPADAFQNHLDDFLRDRHDQIMDPAAYESVMEAKYFRTDDKYECPDCEGQGGFYEYTLDGDIVDAEQCDMCHGRGYIPNTTAQHLLRWGDYKPHELKRVTEAKYAEPNVMNLVGDFFYDDRNTDDYTEYRRVVVKIKVDHDKESTWYDNAVLLDDLKFVGGRPLQTAKDLGIEKGSTVGYQRDKHGWMVFGYIQGEGTSSPWNVSGK